MPATATTSREADLMAKVRAGLILRNTSLAAWARRNDVDLANVRRAIAGDWDGPKGRAIRKKVLKDAGISEEAGR